MDPIKIDSVELESIAKRLIVNFKKMNFRTLLGLTIAALLAAPGLASAMLLTITIDGVDTTRAPDLSNPLENPLITQQPTVFAGLGDCIDLPSVAANACNGTPSDPAIDTNNDPFGTWRDWGLGLNMDQVILGRSSFQVDITGTGPVVLPASALQPFYFLVGATGGGSAGPDPGPNECGGVTTILVPFSRNVTVSDGLGFSQTQVVSSPAKIDITWCDDTITIDPSNAVDFDLTSLGLGTLTFRMDGYAPTNVKPDLILHADVSGVPIPSTLALIGLGLAGIGLRRRDGRAV